MRDPGSHSCAAMRIYYVRIEDSGRQGNGALKKNRKKVRRIGRHPKTAKPPISPRRIVVFQPSVILKQRINGQPSDNSERQHPAGELVASMSRSTH
jgi:hypothetical protein